MLGAPIWGKASTIIEYISIDSRRIIASEKTLFVALQTNARDAHQFIPELIARGVKAFIVNKSFDCSDFQEHSISFITVENTLVVLQEIAHHHRAQFNYPVIGVTGSNGKTIVKEWIFQLLVEDKKVVKSPGSFNSQIGVPLSLFYLQQQHDVAIIEAGISAKNEMSQLQYMIQPTIGVFTGLGFAHDHGFSNRVEKLNEKLKLFEQAEVTIYGMDDELVHQTIQSKKLKTFTWGNSANADVQLCTIQIKSNHTALTVQYQQKQYQFTIPFTDQGSISNAMNAWCTAVYLNVGIENLQSKMSTLQPIDMRLQLKQGANQCLIVNDVYSLDLQSLTIAFDFLKQHQGNLKSTLIISALPYVSNQDYRQVLHFIEEYEFDRVITIGWPLEFNQPHFIAFDSVKSFLDNSSLYFKNEIILIKGARKFHLEDLLPQFEAQIHATVVEIHLNALHQNLNAYRKHLKPATKIMAMVKAFGYGSGVGELAHVLKYQKVDYLAVAYAEEGIQLRNAGIQLPIMVMNLGVGAFEALIKYQLEPEIFSYSLLQQFHEFILHKGLQDYPVHIKVNTGMNRLGFEVSEKEKLIQWWKQNPSTLKIVSIFSHLAASEDPQQDAFTQWQYEQLQHFAKDVATALNSSCMKHIANSAAAIRKEHLQMDMVRLGIGMYGIATVAEQHLNLQPVMVLKTCITQIRTINASDTVGYGRMGKVNRTSKIAVINIGYADGFRRQLGNGIGKVYLRQQLVPVIGNVCMDMTMIDVTDVDGVQEGDEVEIFGYNLPVEKVAEWCKTIPYEILTGISQRVKRVYIQD